MKTVSAIEAYGSTFIFEPPVPMRDEERLHYSLARVATFAWYGAEYPYGLAHELAESGFEELISDNSSNPQILAAKLTEILHNRTQFTVTIEEK